MTYTRGRPTIYRGIRMRSRLEATFAAWLDEIGLEWLYEPQCYADKQGQYLPDFQLLGGNSTFYEVKPPQADTAAALAKMHIIRSSLPRAYLFVVIPTGNYPHQDFATAAVCSPQEVCAVCSGVADHVEDLRLVAGANRSVIR